MMKISDREINSISDWLGGKLPEGSTKDREARRALAKVLRSTLPLDLGFRCALADLIDPDDLPLWLVFKRPRGRTRSINGRRVAAVIWHDIQAGWPKEAAYHHAVEKLGVSLRTAKKAYKAWEKVFAKDGSRLKGLTRIED
jgi:hypothetical protein